MKNIFVTFVCAHSQEFTRQLTMENNLLVIALSKVDVLFCCSHFGNENVFHSMPC